MSTAEQTWTDLFVVLSFVANAIAVVTLLGAGAALVSRAVRRGVLRVVEVAGPVALPLAFGVAAVATWGSLYYSIFADLTPCELCWYQRILMYPLAVILGVGWWRRDRGSVLIALPFVLLGVGVSAFHFLIERYPSLGEGVECSIGVPCNVPYFTEAGFVTIAYMALSGFLAIGALLGIDAVWERNSPEPADAAQDERAEGEPRTARTGERT